MVGGIADWGSSSSTEKTELNSKPERKVSPFRVTQADIKKHLAESKNETLVLRTVYIQSDLDDELRKKARKMKISKNLLIRVLLAMAIKRNRRQ
jgi:hypothetical protein